MNKLSKDKKLPKSEAKPSTAKKQNLKKLNQDLTSRYSKDIAKKIQHQEKKSRSPQIIKLMINELQKQLAQKSKQLQSKATQRKLATTKSTELGTKSGFSTTMNWKSPKNKVIKLPQSQSCDNSVAKVDKSLKSLKKKKSLNNINSSLNEQHHSLNKKPKKSKKEQKQNYVFFGNELIQLNNVAVPLFVVENSSQSFRKSPAKPNYQIDQKSFFIRHSQVPSFDTVYTERTNQVNFIERSFIEEDDNQEPSNEKLENIEFLNIKMTKKETPSILGNDDIKIEQKQVENIKPVTLSKVKQITKEQVTKQSQLQIDLNHIIKLNNSVAKIQKWWKRKIFEQKQKKQREQIALKKSIETIQTKEQSQKLIHERQPHSPLPKLDKSQQSLSQKQIPSTKTKQQPEHEDILHLRETAAHIQFSTHEQILKELLEKQKISEAQFEQKLAWIQLNLQNELKDIQQIRNILKESAKKVESIMKKTKDDIKVVKGIVFECENDEEQENCQSKVPDNPFEEQTKDNQVDILIKIFGKGQNKEEQIPETGIQPITTETDDKKSKVFKLSPYQKDMQEYIDPSQAEQQSFLSSKNKRIFNSPNTGSQQDLGSPYSQTNSDNKEDFTSQSSSQEDLEDIFATQIKEAPSGTAQQQLFSPTLQAANFQELYKEYQEQQETKKQIDSRIAKQLGMNQEQDLIKIQSQIGIGTSIVNIHKFLLNFFKFYLYYHKNQFLTYMNMPYGEAIEVRLSKNKLKDAQTQLQNWKKTTFYTQDDEEIIYGLKNVIDQSILQEFFQSYYEETDIEFSQTEKTNIELQKIHNRAVFEAFNNALNFFRPYYNIGGAPYVWCSSEKSLTFYCIGEENIQQVYEKTQMKILKTASYLCGTNIQIPHKKQVQYKKQAEKQQQQVNSPFKILDNQDDKTRKIDNFEQFLYSYTENFNAAYFANLEDRLKKKQLAECEQQNLQWFTNTFEEGKVSVMLNLSELIEEIILLQECSIIQNLKTQKQSEPDFLDQSLEC